jgi:two-component sensor histidine kinase
VDEVSRRVKNTLALVQGIAAQTFRAWRGAPSPAGLPRLRPRMTC